MAGFAAIPLNTLAQVPVRPADANPAPGQTEGTQPTDTGQPPQAAAESLDRSSPRATMATFLSAVDEAERGQVERYADALACMDLTGLEELPEDGRALQGRKLASILKEFIVAHAVELELIPDDPQGQPYIFHETDPIVRIEPQEDDIWRFTRQSLEAIEVASREAPPAAKPVIEKPAPVKSTPASTTAAAVSEVPAEYRSARATMRSFLDAMKSDRPDDAAKCLDLSEIPVVSRGETGRDLVGFLQGSIVRTKDVALPLIPDTPDGKPYIFRQDDAGVIVIARQNQGDRQGCWLFTKTTVKGIADLYDTLEAQAEQKIAARRAAGEDVQETDPGAAAPRSFSMRMRKHIPDGLRNTWFLLAHWQWLGLVVLALLGTAAHWLVTTIMHGVTRLWLKHKSASVDQQVQVKSFRPVGILVQTGICYWGLQQLTLPPQVLAVLMYAVKFVACWAVVWTVYRAVDLLADYFKSLAETTRTTVDDLLVPFARKSAKILVTVLGVLFVVQQFTEEPPFQLLAGLGLGGLALALAAQDTLKNLFGSLTVIIDRPFKVGDWVLIGDIEGTIESVGFRSTRVRTFYNSQVVVPNSGLMSATIDNFGARQYRRAKIMLSVTYSTPPEKIDAFCEGIRELVRLHPYTRKDYYHVYFNKFAASSLDILLYIFFEAPDWSTELRERHMLFLDILRLARKLGVEFAFPTQTLWLQRNTREQKGASELVIGSDPDDPARVGQEQAAGVFAETYGDPPAHRGPVTIERTPGSKTHRPA